MKTGRLLKFHRPRGEIQAYLYRQGPVVRAELYRPFPPRSGPAKPLPSFSGESEEEVEERVRRWVDEHFPKGR